MPKSPQLPISDVGGDRAPRFHRRCIRVFFIVAVLVIMCDVVPPTWPGMMIPKRWLTAFLNRAGLWQGQWSMFAPNPIVNNSYLSAELEDRDGKRTYWDSPDWKHAGSFRKFYAFRYLNYYDFLPYTDNAFAINDFADFLARTASTSPVRKLSLAKVSLSIVIPEAGPLPAHDDTIWISSSQFLTERHYDPRW